jgi:O-antigen/teichoic acid export membrane protein
VSLVKNTSITVAGRFISSGAGALAALVVANALGAKGAGVYAQVRVLPNVIAAMLGAGITIANPYLVGSRKYPVRAITETTAALALILGIAGWIAWWAAGDLLHAHIYTELTATAALMVGLSIPLNMVRDYLNSIQQGLQQFKGANLVMTLDDVASMVLVLPLLAGYGGTRLIVIAAVGGTAASAILAAVMLAWQGYVPWPRLHRAIVIDAMKFGIKGHIGRMANMLNWRLDVMILSTLASVEVVGCYSVASKVAELFRPVSASLTFVLRPLIASLSVAEARAKGVFLYRRFFIINLGAIAVMAVIGGPAILHFFGPEFASAVPAFQILLIGLAAHGADGVLNGYNVGIGRPEFNTYTALIGCVITVIGDVLLIPSLGINGAAITSSVAYTAKAIALTALFLATSGVTVAQLAGFEEYTADAA